METSLSADGYILHIHPTLELQGTGRKKTDHLPGHSTQGFVTVVLHLVSVILEVIRIPRATGLGTPSCSSYLPRD